MGGCIGLRALYSGLDVQAACFTGPMWGIKIAPHLRPVAWGMGAIMQQVSKGKTRAPGTSVQSYVNITPFEGNMLTKNAETYAWMREQLQTQPDLALGGPSLSWLIEGLRECRDLAKLPAPTTPCLTFMGTDERIVEKPPIVSRMAGWENGSLEIIPKAEHEILMEIPKTRDRAIDQIADFFARYAAPSTSL
jgi:lysophospholipase